MICATIERAYTKSKERWHAVNITTANGLFLFVVVPIPTRTCQLRKEKSVTNLKTKNIGQKYLNKYYGCVNLSVNRVDLQHSVRSSSASLFMIRPVFIDVYTRRMCIHKNYELEQASKRARKKNLMSEQNA